MIGCLILFRGLILRHIMLTTADKPSISKAESWKMFDRISSRYDFLNRFLSLGLDVFWRRRLGEHLPDRPKQNLLDLATGTGDVPIVLVKKDPRIFKAVGVDLAEHMLRVGRKKVHREGLDGRIVLQPGDANQLPFPNGSFDCATMAFGIRNVDNPVNVLKEIFRVLRPDGRALILEFSLPRNILLRAGAMVYLRTVVPIAGGLVSGNISAYRYLNRTIEKFPCGQLFCRLMRQTGFRNVKATELSLGIATIYQGDRIK